LKSFIQEFAGKDYTVEKKFQYNNKKELKFLKFLDFHDKLK